MKLVFQFHWKPEMQYFVRRPWDLHQRQHTSPDVFRKRGIHRRDFLRAVGMGIGGAAVLPSSGCHRATDEEIFQAGAVETKPEVAAEVAKSAKDKRFEYGRAETSRRDAAEYTNFYEFSGDKDNWRHVSKFKPTPWSVEIDGLCSKPTVLDLDEIARKFSLEERAYRHRCVETWAMCVPWIGFPLRDLLKLVEPKSAAKYVSFETFHRPAEAPNSGYGGYPWPYTEGLTIEEATNELAFLATGIFGESLPKQHGAPIRLVVPWKYGFKSCKSILRISLTDTRPATFWNSVAPNEYAFEANVDPNVPHPRWSQQSEWMLGTYERFATQKYNGYGDYVGRLYG